VTGEPDHGVATVLPGPLPPDGLQPGERFTQQWGPSESGRLEAPSRPGGPDGPDGPHIWHTLGYRRVLWEPGRTAVAWDAPEAYCFPSAGGPIVQGGLVTALLDAAMGGATWTVLDAQQAFLTADLRVEFLRTATPGLLTAVGAVVRRTRRVVFAAAELFDDTFTLLATSRCTQVVLPAAGRAGRHDS
jgi:uncharacterized protein (TIGR00369 family)